MQKPTELLGSAGRGFREYKQSGKHTVLQGNPRHFGASLSPSAPRSVPAAGAEAERDHELAPTTSPPPPPPNHCTDTHKELAEHFFKQGQSRCGGGPDGSAFGEGPKRALAATAT